MPSLVDANLLIDLVEKGPTWADWLNRQPHIAATAGARLNSDVAYAELAPSFAT